MSFLPTTTHEGLDAASSELRDALVPFIGERAVTLFSYAISDEAGCLVLSTVFRTILIGNGEDPDHPSVTEAEQLLIDWGRLIARDPAGITPEFYSRLEATFNPQLRAALLAFAGSVVARSLFAIVGRVPVDEER